MANFSAKERLIASLLSATPGLKAFVKDIYIGINAVIYKKSYKSKILAAGVDSIGTVEPSSEAGETFFGYYDKSPMNRQGWVLYNETTRSTRSTPSATAPITVNATNILTGQTVRIGESLSYTWQQGCRAQWLDDDTVIYNDFRDGRHVAVTWSLSRQAEIKVFDRPVQDSYKTAYFLSIDYRRIMKLRPDYGYRNLPLPTDDEMKNLAHDGIWMVDNTTGKSHLLHSLEEIAAVNHKPTFDTALHKVNHVMISPDGGGFIFIHRYYLGRRRFDRLFYSDFKSLRLLSDNQMVSHCCWIDNDTVMGYLRHDDKDGFYYIDIPTGTFTEIPEMTRYNHGDGHPSCSGPWVVFDSYPDKSRMQHLTLFNRRTVDVVPVAEVFQDTAFKGETRCDLHPRFSMDGQVVLFDSVYNGRRQLCYVNISKIVS